jgi:hypothetical protein
VAIKKHHLKKIRVKKEECTKTEGNKERSSQAERLQPA